MDAIKQGIGFRATGQVQRIFIPPSNKVAFVTLEIAGDRPRKHELRAFDAPVMSQLSNVTVGSIITVTGSVDCEPQKDKAKNDVQVDGRTLWAETLTIKTVRVDKATAVSGPDLGDPEDPDNNLAF